MKISLLKLWVMWRRFRRTSPRHNEHHLQYIAEIEALMRRANPFAAWSDRANWMIDVAVWLGRSPAHSSVEEHALRSIKQQRARFLLDWLDSHRDVRRVVQTTLQKTLREAIGPELFCVTGMPHEPAFFGDLAEHVTRTLLPNAPVRRDWSALFTAMFPDPSDADWLISLDHKTLARIWKLCADDGIVHNFRQQIDEALIYLVSMIIAVGISPEFRQRLEPRVPFKATPFMALQRELEKYLLADPHDEAALRGVRMLVAVCQAQTDRIYAHLDEFGVSVKLVYQVERMRAQLARMARLIVLRSTPPETQLMVPVQALLADLIEAHHHRSTARGLISRSFSLLARKIVERNADRGEQYLARDGKEYRAMFHAACRGGVVSVFIVLLKGALPGAGVARFFEGAFASLNYVAGFLAISALGGALAARQPAITAPALASKMQSLDTAGGLRALLAEIGGLLRSQSAGIFGSLVAVVPVMLAVSLLISLASGTPPMQPDKAHGNLQELSMLGLTPIFATFTGVLLWLSSLVAGFADNWFALRNMREALAHHRRLVHVLGPLRTERCAGWLERNVAGIAGNVSLALLLGISPVLLQFFGLPLDVRHVALSAGTLVAAAGSLGWSVTTTMEFWLAVGGVLLTGILNVGVAFGFALGLALQARDVPLMIRRVIFRSVLKRLFTSPRFFLLPTKNTASVAVLPAATVSEPAPETRESVRRAKTGP